VGTVGKLLAMRTCNVEFFLSDELVADRAALLFYSTVRADRLAACNLESALDAAELVW
jgi:hypothetical protein